MIEFAATLYVIEKLIGWFFIICFIIFAGVILYQDYKFEKQRKERNNLK